MRSSSIKVLNLSGNNMAGGCVVALGKVLSKVNYFVRRD